MKHESLDKNCPDCGKSMKRTVKKKGSYYKRGIYVFTCECGYSETVFGDEMRENAINKGLLDDDLDIIKDNF